MLRWQYKNWLRRRLLGHTAMETAATYEIEKHLGFVGKTKWCIYFLFYEWSFEKWGCGYVYVNENKGCLTCLRVIKGKCKAYYEMQVVPNKDFKKVQGAMQKPVVSHALSSTFLLTLGLTTSESPQKHWALARKIFSWLKKCSSQKVKWWSKNGKESPEHFFHLWHKEFGKTVR